MKDYHYFVNTTMPFSVEVDGNEFYDFISLCEKNHVIKKRLVDFSDDGFYNILFDCYDNYDHALGTVALIHICIGGDDNDT